MFTPLLHKKNTDIKKIITRNWLLSHSNALILLTNLSGSNDNINDAILQNAAKIEINLFRKCFALFFAIYFMYSNCLIIKKLKKNGKKKFLL